MVRKQVFVQTYPRIKITRNGVRHKIGEGDIVQIANDQEDPYVALVKELGMNKDGDYFARCTWFYNVNDVREMGARTPPGCAENELFLSQHRDDVSAESILGVVRVRFFRSASGEQFTSQVYADPPNYDVSALPVRYLCRREFDPVNKVFTDLSLAAFQERQNHLFERAPKSTNPEKRKKPRIVAHPNVHPSTRVRPHDQDSVSVKSKASGNGAKARDDSITDEEGEEKDKGFHDEAKEYAYGDPSFAKQFQRTDNQVNDDESLSFVGGIKPATKTVAMKTAAAMAAFDESKLTRGDKIPASKKRKSSDASDSHRDVLASSLNSSNESNVRKSAFKTPTLDSLQQLEARSESYLAKSATEDSAIVLELGDVMSSTESGKINLDGALKSDIKRLKGEPIRSTLKSPSLVADGPDTNYEAQEWDSLSRDGSGSVGSTKSRSSSIQVIAEIDSSVVDSLRKRMRTATVQRADETTEPSTTLFETMNRMMMNSNVNPMRSAETTQSLAGIQSSDDSIESRAAQHTASMPTRNQETASHARTSTSLMTTFNNSTSNGQGPNQSTSTVSNGHLSASFNSTSQTGSVSSLSLVANGQPAPKFISLTASDERPVQSGQTSIGASQPSQSSFAPQVLVRGFGQLSQRPFVGTDNDVVLRAGQSVQPASWQKAIRSTSIAQIGHSRPKEEMGLTFRSDPRSSDQVSMNNPHQTEGFHSHVNQKMNRERLTVDESVQKPGSLNQTFDQRRDSTDQWSGGNDLRRVITTTQGGSNLKLTVTNIQEKEPRRAQESSDRDRRGSSDPVKSRDVAVNQRHSLSGGLGWSIHPTLANGPNPNVRTFGDPSTQASVPIVPYVLLPDGDPSARNIILQSNLPLGSIVRVRSTGGKQYGTNGTIGMLGRVVNNDKNTETIHVVPLKAVWPPLEFGPLKYVGVPVRVPDEILTMPVDLDKAMHVTEAGLLSQISETEVNAACMLLCRELNRSTPSWKRYMDVVTKTLNCSPGRAAVVVGLLLSKDGIEMSEKYESIITCERCSARANKDGYLVSCLRYFACGQFVCRTCLEDSHAELGVLGDKKVVLKGQRWCRILVPKRMDGLQRRFVCRSCYDLACPSPDPSDLQSISGTFTPSEVSASGVGPPSVATVKDDSLMIARTLRGTLEGTLDPREAMETIIQTLAHQAELTLRTLGEQ